MNFFYKLNLANVHAPCLPNNFRMLIVGASGMGKTTLLMKLLLEKHFLNYDKLYILVDHFINRNIEYYNQVLKIN